MHRFPFSFFLSFSLSFLAGSVDECAVNERRMKRPLCSPRCSQPCLICALAVERLQAHSGSKLTARLMTLVFANWPWVLLIFNARLSPDPYTTPVQVRLRHQRRKMTYAMSLQKSSRKEKKKWSLILGVKAWFVSTLVSLRWYAHVGV